ICGGEKGTWFCISLSKAMRYLLVSFPILGFATLSKELQPPQKGSTYHWSGFLSFRIIGNIYLAILFLLPIYFIRTPHHLRHKYHHTHPLRHINLRPLLVHLHPSSHGQICHIHPHPSQQ